MKILFTLPSTQIPKRPQGRRTPYGTFITLLILAMMPTFAEGAGINTSSGSGLPSSTSGLSGQSSNTGTSGGLPNTSSTSSIPGLGGTAGMGSTTGIPTVPQGLVPALNNLADGARALAGAAPEVAEAGRALASATDHLAQELGPLSDSVESVAESLSGFTDMGYGVLDMLESYQDLISTQSQAWRGTVDGASDSIRALSSALQSLSDPKRMAGVAAASAFAGTLASTIASKVPALLFEGAATLQEAITHNQRNALDSAAVRSILGEFGKAGEYQIVEDRVQSLVRMISAGLRLLETAERIQKRNPVKADEIKISSWIIEDLARLRTRQDLLERKKAQAGDDPNCLLEFNRELIGLEQEIRPMDEALRKYSDQYQVLDGRFPTQQICAQLEGVWPALSDAEAGLQMLRGRVLASQTGFLQESLKEFRAVRKSFEQGRKGLAEDRDLREKAGKSYLPHSSESKVAARLMKDQLIDLKVSQGATEEDIADRIDLCIKTRTTEARKTNGNERFFLDSCKQDVLREVLTGDYGKQRGEIYARFSDFAEGLGSMQNQQEMLIQKLHPSSEIEEAYLLGKSSQFLRVAVDQSTIKDRYRRLSELEARFMKACSAELPASRRPIFK